MMGVSAGMVLGVPIVSYIAAVTSLKSAMLCFALVNGIALAATILFVPSLPVTERMSYGTQLSVLKRTETWLSIFGVILLNGSIFGVYSYLSEYLNTVTGAPVQLVSVVLLLYGVANIAGNAAAGRLLTGNAIRFVVVFPFLLGAVYFLMIFLGHFTVPAVILILAWGILAGAGANINQYWIVSAAPNAPDFANGLFLAAANLGTTIGTTVCGLLISGIGTAYIPLGGIVLLVLGFLSILLRIQSQSPGRRDRLGFSQHIMQAKD